MVITKLLRPLYIAKPLTSTKRAFSTNFRQPLDLKDLKRSKVNTTFVEVSLFLEVIPCEYVAIRRL